MRVLILGLRSNDQAHVIRFGIALALLHLANTSLDHRHRS